jgi:hypothetical protein
MDDVGRSDRAEVVPDFAASLTQITSDATRRVCEQGQTVTHTMSEWNTEVSHFLSRRVARNGETIGRMTKCQNLPEVFAIQAQWVQDAADDYLKEMSKLMEVNSKLVSSLMRSAGQTGTRS